jgi:hypothetical protein
VLTWHWCTAYLLLFFVFLLLIIFPFNRIL